MVDGGDALTLTTQPVCDVVWLQVFLNKVQDIAARVPYMVTPGNHELWYNFSAYKHRFTIPGSNENMYYSWEAGYAHFIAGNSETAVDTAWFSPHELAWMADDMASFDRTTTPWLIAHFHRPMYCSNSKQNCEHFAKLLRYQAEDLFVDNSVDLVLTAHVHDYERSYPVINSTKMQSDFTSPSAPVYIVQGASGNREGNTGFPADMPEWNANSCADIGYGLMTVDKSEISWSFYTVNSTGSYFHDSFTMTK